MVQAVLTVVEIFGPKQIVLGVATGKRCSCSPAKPSRAGTPTPRRSRAGYTAPTPGQEAATDAENNPKNPRRECINQILPGRGTGWDLPPWSVTDACCRSVGNCTAPYCTAPYCTARSVRPFMNAMSHVPAPTPCGPEAGNSVGVASGKYAMSE